MAKLTKAQTRKIILKARRAFKLTDAEMARLLVGEGRGPKGTYDKWVVNEDSPDLRKASDGVIRHIETLYAMQQNCPSAFFALLDSVKKT